MPGREMVYVVEARYYSDDQMLADVIHIASSEELAEQWIQAHGDEEADEDAWFAVYNVRVDERSPANNFQIRQIKFFNRHGRRLRSQPELVHERVMSEPEDADDDLE